MTSRFTKQNEGTPKEVRKFPQTRGTKDARKGN